MRMGRTRGLIRLVLCTYLAFSEQAWAAEGLDLPPSGLPKVDPAAAGMQAETLDQIAPRMQQFVDRGEAAGIVTLLARRGQVVHWEAVGQADLEARRAMRPDSIFLIASMTKPVTATAMMILQDEGRLSLADPVAKYLPEFAEVRLGAGRPSREITLRDLLTHTSGLGGSQQCEGSLEETAAALARRPLDFEPGTKWQYSPGLNVCGRVIEVVSGKSYQDFLQERIFEPLKMADTSFRLSSGKQARLAKLYQPGGKQGTLTAAAHWLIDLSPDVVPNPSGGLYSTAPDMSRFYQMVLNGGQLDGRRIVSAGAVRQMTSLQTGDLTTGFTPGNGWGLGWCIVRQPQQVTEMLAPGTFGHGGAFGTQGWVDPQRELIFVLMIQRNGFGNSDGSDIRGAFQQLAVAAIEQ